jgi:hypothetical protein
MIIVVLTTLKTYYYNLNIIGNLYYKKLDIIASIVQR